MLKTERNDIIREYFTAGLTHAEIVRFLARIHDCQISVRQVKRILAASNCMHRKNHSPVEQIVEFIHRQLSTSRKLCGYRFMHKICLKNGIHVPRSMVQEILKLLDPVGVETRRIHRLQRRRYNGIGPNHIWHVDSYDKLKGYGICINGCIDGYSRKLIWLVASKNSNDPRVIAGNYIASIEKERGCPRILRADRGTENVTMGHMQQWLRRNGQDRFAGNKSMLYGRSTANQRMEQWWNFLRRHWAQYWMDIFKTLAQNGHFSGSWLDKNLIQFCFLRKIQVTYYMLCHLHACYYMFFLQATIIKIVNSAVIFQVF